MPNLLNRKWFTIGLVFLLAWLGQGLWRVYQHRADAAVQLHDIERKVTDMERNNAFLASASAYFASDAYLERQARLKLNYKLPGEEVTFVYKDTSVKDIPAVQAWKDRLAAMPNWKKWWYWLLGH